MLSEYHMLIYIALTFWNIYILQKNETTTTTTNCVCNTAQIHTTLTVIGLSFTFTIANNYLIKRTGFFIYRKMQDGKTRMNIPAFHADTGAITRLK